MYRFDLSHEALQRYTERCAFTDEEEQILIMRRKGKSIIAISMALNLSESTVLRRIHSIRHKMDREGFDGRH